MTRSEFINGVTTWRELLDFCYENDCNICDSIIPHDELGDYISDDLHNYAYEFDWREISAWLDNIYTSSLYYYHSGCFEYEPADTAFDDYKNEVLSWCDEMANVFDEDEDSISQLGDDRYEEFDISDNDCNVEEFLGLCSTTIKS